MYQLTKKGSIGWHDEDGRYHRISKGQGIDKKAYKSLSKRHKGFFEDVEVETEAEVEDKTVEELKAALDEADIEYDSKAKKAELLELYSEHIEE